MTGTRVFGHSTMQAETPAFQLPKQWHGEDLCANCDVCALDAVLTELFGAKSIWDKMTNHTIIYSVAHLGEVPKFDHVHLDVQAIVRLCLCAASNRASAATISGMVCELDREILTTVFLHSTSHIQAVNHHLYLLGTIFSPTSVLSLLYHLWFSGVRLFDMSVLADNATLPLGVGFFLHVVSFSCHFTLHKWSNLGLRILHQMWDHLIHRDMT